MAFDKVVDSAALDAGMTGVADAIRAKAGTTEPLAWPDGYISAIAAIHAGSIGVVSPYLSLTGEFITIGANTVSGAEDARTYLSTILNNNEMAFLENEATENNQVVCYSKGEIWFCVRIRDGVLSSIYTANNLYDALLVEGTKYNIVRVGVPK